MQSSKLFHALRLIVTKSFDSGKCKNTRDTKSHVCLQSCERLELQGFPELFYCLHSGNVHFCGFGTCRYMELVYGQYRCPLTGRVLGKEIKPIVEDPGDDESGFHTGGHGADTNRFLGKAARAEQKRQGLINEEITNEEQALRRSLFAAKSEAPEDMKYQELYRDLLVESIVERPQQEPPTSATAQIKDELRERFLTLRKSRGELELVKRAGAAFDVFAHNPGVSRKGYVARRLYQLRARSEQKAKRRQYFLRASRAEKARSTATSTRAALLTSTRPVGPSQQRRIIGNFHLNTRRIQRRAKVSYLSNAENIRADARAFLDLLIKLNEEHFKLTNPSVDPTPSPEDLDYAVDRCAALWMAIVQTKLFAKSHANASQSLVFLYVVFRSLRDGSNWEGVYTCRAVEFFRTRFMDVNVISGRGISLDKNVVFKAKSLTQFSGFVQTAMKEAMGRTEPAATSAATEDPVEKQKKTILSLMASCTQN